MMSIDGLVIRLIAEDPEQSSAVSSTECGNFGVSIWSGDRGVVAREGVGVEPWFVQGEDHGLSVFFRLDDVFHTYSTYARGCESLTDSYQLLDLLSPWRAGRPVYWTARVNARLIKNVRQGV
jgi:predicted dithiol-disulfide oxidoreductase (DUF899 family)